MFSLEVQKIKIKALWLQSEIGACGYIGAILGDGIPVGLCSVEKWNLGRTDSLRKGWKNNIKIFKNIKTMYQNVSEEDLRKDGLLKNTNLELTVPNELKQYVKDNINLYR